MDLPISFFMARIISSVDHDRIIVTYPNRTRKRPHQYNNIILCTFKMRITIYCLRTHIAASHGLLSSGQCAMIDWYYKNVIYSDNINKVCHSTSARKSWVLIALQTLVGNDVLHQ